MPSIVRGETSSPTDPILDLYIEEPAGTPSDVAVLEFRILDLTGDDPVQVFPVLAEEEEPPTWEPLDPTASPTAETPGHRLGEGHYYAPWTAPVDASIGDHEVEWRFKLTLDSEYEHAAEEFYVAEEHATHQVAYCTVGDLRQEGFTVARAPDARIKMLARLATTYIDKMTGRWFTPRTFTEDRRYKVDGRGARDLFLNIPIIRLDALYIESQGVVDASVDEIETDSLRVYNRHLAGQNDDDRENPRIAFIEGGRIVDTVGSGLFPGPRMFPLGVQNIHLEGVFGYTDYDGTELGETPWLIRRACMLLVARELNLMSQACDRLNTQNKFRIIGDREGSGSVNLQGLWLKGAFTGDPEIDTTLMAFKRPAALGAC